MIVLPTPMPGEIVDHLRYDHDQVPVGLLDADWAYVDSVHDALHPNHEHEHSGTWTWGDGVASEIRRAGDYRPIENVNPGDAL